LKQNRPRLHLFAYDWWRRWLESKSFDFQRTVHNSLDFKWNDKIGNPFAFAHISPITCGRAPSSEDDDWTSRRQAKQTPELGINDGRLDKAEMFRVCQHGGQNGRSWDTYEVDSKWTEEEAELWNKKNSEKPS
jgi:hypothetical protein